MPISSSIIVYCKGSGEHLKDVLAPLPSTNSLTAVKLAILLFTVFQLSFCIFCVTLRMIQTCKGIKFAEVVGHNSSCNTNIYG